METTKMGSDKASCSSAAVVSSSSSILLPLEKNSDFVPGYEYDVFLSFRGTDTRSGFTDRLYRSLRDAGLQVFRDDDELRDGEPIEKNLMEAINKSQISIAILSENYGGSKWCLKELVHMAECMHAGNQIIMPIFYKVSPRDVRHQSGSFGASFHSNNKKCNFNEETIRKWKETLMEVGNLKGRHVKDDSVDRNPSAKAFWETKESFCRIKESAAGGSISLASAHLSARILSNLSALSPKPPRDSMMNGSKLRPLTCILCGI